MHTGQRRFVGRCTFRAALEFPSGISLIHSAESLRLFLSSQNMPFCPNILGCIGMPYCGGVPRGAY